MIGIFIDTKLSYIFLERRQCAREFVRGGKYDELLHC